MKTREEALAKLKRKNIEDKTRATHDVELAFITVDLYPTEVLEAAAQAIGLEQYIVDIYKFALDAQAQQMQIKVAQLSGVLMTHKKIQKWLTKMDIQDVLDLSNPAVMRIWLNASLKKMKEATEVFEIIANTLAGDK